MGDRANVHVKAGDFVDLYFYTHWAGTELPETVQKAMRRGKERWNDPAYLARIIFSEMIREDVDGVTGYGISSKVGDGEDRIVRVDCGAQTVSINGKKFSFKEFAQAKPEQIAWRA